MKLDRHIILKGSRIYLFLGFIWRDENVLIVGSPILEFVIGNSFDKELSSVNHHNHKKIENFHQLLNNSLFKIKL